MFFTSNPLNFDFSEAHMCPGTYIKKANHSLPLDFECTINLCSAIATDGLTCDREYAYRFSYTKKTNQMRS